MDVTDETFQAEVLDRSATVPVIVDLWAEWCGPCKTLGPMLEKAVADTGGAVELAKVNVDDNPAVAQAFNVQSIPAVFALSQGQVVDQFIGAVPEAQITAFVQQLAPSPSEADTLAEAGDEASLRKALELEPDHVGATEGLARILIDRGEPAEALALLGRLPETETSRTLAAEARLLEAGVECRGPVGPKSKPSWTSCSSGCATTTRPGRSSWTCWRPWAPTTRAPRSTAGIDGAPVLMAVPAPGRRRPTPTPSRSTSPRCSIWAAAATT